jgi:peptidoglycan hydrolase CwlO-like protein
MADRQVKLLENQDKKTDRNHLKVSISEMKPVVNVVTAAQVMAKITTQEKEIENLQSEIVRCQNEIDNLNALLSEIEKATV